MRFFLIILLLSPVAVQASCLDNNDPTYNFAVSQGNYEEAFQLVAHELRLSPEEARHFRIVQGFSDTHDDRHGQADPDTMELRLDPGLFIEGKEGACQGLAHELAHLKQFQRDRRELHAFYTKNAVAPNGWDHCERDNFGNREAHQAEKDAYACLEDNDLITHTAAEDIEAVLAQTPFARDRKLREEDISYLTDQLRSFAQNVTMIQDQSNISYYLPQIKRQDTRQFCRGVRHIQENRMNISPYYQIWQMYCRVNPAY